MNYILTFRDPLAANIELSGGKGSNLAILTQRGFPVPPGFIVTARAYRDFICAGADILRDVHKLPFGNPALMRAESDKLRQLLGRLVMPPAVTEEIRRQLARFPKAQSFSVRSSSTMEDLANAAFAGQHETYLNCSGPEQILEKIKACFLSLWSDRAMAYRHQQRFNHDRAAMAVVVQQMILCDTAGVGFSINPVNGNLSEMVIDANFGLGESVVSGEGEVDHYVIDRSTREIRSSNIVQKSRKIIGAMHGIREVHLDMEEGGRPCLTRKQLSLLANLLLDVETSYRFPQDIEWGFVNEELFLFQSRPVTTIPPRWTRDESAERFPNVVTPLTWDFIENGFHQSLDYSFRLMGFPSFSGKWFAMHSHYIYGNQNAVELYGRRVPFVARDLNELRAAIPKLREEFRWIQELPVSWARDLDFYLISIGKFMAEPLAYKSLPEVWEFVREVDEHGVRYFLPNIAISIAHSSLYRLLNRLLQMVFGPDAAHPLLDRLMAFCETKTGVINKELFELASIIRTQPALEKIFNKHSSPEIIGQKMLKPFPEFQSRLDKFLRDHGHREVDFDAYSPTWIESPWVVLDNVRLILQTPMELNPVERERDLKIQMQHAERELFQKLPPDLHFFFGEVLRLARIYTSLDDLEHYQTTRLTLPLRRGLRELGGRLAERGILDEAMDIFFARRTQMDEAIHSNSDNSWKKFRQLVHCQKESWLKGKARKPEWTLGESQPPEVASSGCLSGMAGSSGQAEGKVFLVAGSDDFAKFPKGGVLVARTTNPAWTPLFYSAAAVITESGGPLSHGAVTAREMRIPAVMSVKESLSRLKNGQRVRVDGTRGKVYLL
jgi:rifampicin phosphotransferase